MKASIAVISIGAMTSGSIIIRIITTAGPIMVFTTLVGRVASDSAAALAASTADRIGSSMTATVVAQPKS
jgi:hypothetical protein